MDPILRFDVGDTRQFTVAYSQAPSTTPYLAIYTGSINTTLVSSQTASTSSTTTFYAFWTLPTSRLFYTFAWVASFSQGPVVNRGMFQAILVSG